MSHSRIEKPRHFPRFDRGGCSGWLWLLALGVGLGVQPLAAADAVLISEFVANNNGAPLDEDGAASDWIEIYNPGSIAVDLTGWHLTDDASTLNKWTFPATNLPAKSFLLVWASGKDRAVTGAPLHTSFSLNSQGGYLALVHPDGVTIASEFAPAYPQQHAGFSFGQVQGVTVNQLIASNAPVRVLVPADSSLDASWRSPAFDDAAWLAGTNGAGYETSLPGWAVRVFKANLQVDTLAKAEAVIATPTQQSATYAENVAVVNYVNSGAGANYPNDRLVPGFGVADTDDYVIEAVGTVTIPAAGNWTFGVNTDDGFKLTVGSFVDICDCLRGPGDTLATFNVPAAGDYPMRLVFFERGGGSEVEVFAAQTSATVWNSTFKLVGDVPNGGLAVRSQPVAANNGIGYRSLIKTDIQPQMLSNNPTAYIRLPFTVTNAAALTQLTLTVRFDDGFVAYLNGVEVARRNAPASPQWNSAATTNHSATAGEAIYLTDRLGLLQDGTNLLAIQGLNLTAADTDFLVEAELTEFKVAGSTNYQFFPTATPNAPNSTPPVAGFVGDTHFSVDRGFFDTPISVALTCETAGAAIYYTTNGSRPSPTNGVAYSAPLSITNTTTLRIAAYLAGLYPSDVDTATYIFLTDVIRQKEGVAPGAGWPAPRGRGAGAQTYDYGLDSTVVNSAAVAPTIINDLRSIPTFSVVVDLKDAFDPATGFYANPGGDTIAWERPCSLELMYPDGSEGFQVNCGIRIRGGYSRSTDNPKHGLRIFFRTDYGPGSLKFPLLASQGGTDEFQKFDLRTFQNYSWSFDGDSRFIAMRDTFSRDTQLAMGQPGTRGDVYHLYLNGAYWGVYNIEERAEANFGATYFGGDATNYDTIKVSPDDGYIIYATDGDLAAWTRLWMQATNGLTSDAAYFKVQGLNPDGTPNPAYENLIDVDNLIDYMLVILFGGNLDAPISNFLSNVSPNNFFALRDRTGAHGGFRFMAHDSEHTLLDVNANRIGPFFGNDAATGWALNKSNPQYIWQQMWTNGEFRIKMADRVQQHFFNGGALTTSNALGRFMARSNAIYQAVNAESARWGNANHSPSFTRTDWKTAMNFVAGTFIPQRGAVVLSQLQGKGLWPTVSAPRINQFGGLVSPGFAAYLTNANASGVIYYTLTGADPRLLGGAANPAAVTYTAGTPIAINFQTALRARVLSGGVWSPIIQPNFYTSQDFTRLLVSEIMYNPPADGLTPGDAFEFLELKNTGTGPLDLSGLFFSAGINFAFTNGTLLAPGSFFVLGRDAAALGAKYPGLVVNGLYTGKLDNNGDKITISHPLGGTILSFAYNNSGAWPIAPGGWGFSLVPKNPGSNPEPGKPGRWRASTNRGGSPGADDPAALIPPVVINEILANSVPPNVDAIELFNPSGSPADISGWWLSDDEKVPWKIQVPPNTILPAGGYRVFTEADFNPTPGTNGSFALGSAGESIHLFSSDGTTNLTGYSAGFAFDASPAGVTLGRYTISTGEDQLALLSASTLGSPNSGPLIGPVVVRQIMYHPPDLPGLVDDTADEYIELVNRSGAPVPFYDPLAPTNTWHLRGGVNYDFPAGFILGAGSNVVLVGFPPASPTFSVPFHSHFALFANTPLFGPWTGKLDNSSDTVEIKRPDVPDTNGVAYIAVDKVEYKDVAPWPVGPDGTGAALTRVALSSFGNDPANWTSVTPLTIVSNPTNLTTKTTSNITFSIMAAGTPPLTYQWRLNGNNLLSGGGYSGVTAATLAITNVQQQHAGSYSVAITDMSGTGYSLPATLTVLVVPTILQAPPPQVVAAGSRITVGVVIAGDPAPFGYQWRSNSYVYPLIISNSRTNFVTLPTPPFPWTNTFRIIVTNAASQGTTINASFSVITLADGDADGIPDAWSQQYFGHPSGQSGDLSRAGDDFDGDGMSNLDEYLAGTDPGDSNSYLRINETITPGAAAVNFAAVSNRTYTVQFTDQLPAAGWQKLADVLARPTNHVEMLPDPDWRTNRFYRAVTPRQP